MSGSADSGGHMPKLRTYRSYARYVKAVRLAPANVIDQLRRVCPQVGIFRITKPYGAIIAFGDDVHEAVAVAGVYVEMRITPRHFSKHRWEVRWPEGQRRRDTEATAQVTSGQDRFPGNVDLRAYLCRVIPEGRTGFC